MSSTLREFVSYFPKHASGMKGSVIHMKENPVDTLAVAAGRPIVSEATLSQAWPLSVKTCHLVWTRRKILRFVETRRHILARPELPRKMRARNILGHFWTKNRENNARFRQIGIAFFQGACFMWKKKWPVSEAHGLYLPMVFCQSKILGGVFKYGLPDGLPDMAFQT